MPLTSLPSVNKTAVGAVSELHKDGMVLIVSFEAVQDGFLSFYDFGIMMKRALVISLPNITKNSNTLSRDALLLIPLYIMGKSPPRSPGSLCL